jgi:hypothetical protein
MRPFLIVALLVSSLWSCTLQPLTPPDASVVDGGNSTDGGNDGGVARDGGSPDAGGGLFEQLTFNLKGDFDNAAQVAMTGTKRVERHVCSLPGRPQTGAVAWLYVEHVEDLPTGKRDAYFTRVNEVFPIDGGFRSRAFRFVTGHPLASNAFAFNGPRDGCWKPTLLQSISDADLTYRAGCDVDFRSDGDGGFSASTTGMSCIIPGGYIQTRAYVFPDGLDSEDTAVSGGTETGDLFQFRRVFGWLPPDAG